MNHWMGRAITLIAALGILSQATHAGGDGMLGQPALSKEHLAFIYAGDIWIADRDGDNPRRLTSHPATEEMPFFSPDGTQIAFTAGYHGNRDVYVISVKGGQAQRLTWHPWSDLVNGWTPDGKSVVFSSSRERGLGRSSQLWHVPVAGGAPVKQMRARFFRGSYNKDGSKLAYIPFMTAYNGLYGFSSGWRLYRGGTQPSVSIMDLENKTEMVIDGKGFNDLNPLWIGDTVYFLSDRNDKNINIFRFKNGTIEQVSDEDVWDIRWMSAAGNSIVYEAGGSLKMVNVRNGRTKKLDIDIAPDLPQVMPVWKNASRNLTALDLSPTGKRVLVTARGEVFSVPTKDGSTRNLSDTGSAREYSALWSPKGSDIAYIEDDGTAQSLILVDQSGLEEKRKIALPVADDFYMLENWTADGTAILVTDNHLKLHMVTLADGTVTPIAETAYRTGFTVDSSPDSRFIAFDMGKPNLNQVIMVYDRETGETHQITDRFATAGNPTFSPDGKYLFFRASTNTGPQAVGLDMSSQERPNRYGLYAVVLKADGKSPLLPKPGDEEGEKAENKAAADEKAPDAEKDDTEKDDAEKDDADQTEKTEEQAKPASIDFDNIDRRIVALPVSLSAYNGLAAGKDGALYFVERTQPGAKVTAPGSPGPLAEWALKRFDFSDKKTSTVTKGLLGFTMADDGVHLAVIRPGNRVAVGKAGKSVSLKPVNMADVRVYTNPRDEWAMIMRDVKRMERGYFYDPDLHGLDWDAVYERYKKRLPAVGRREDLNSLLVEMIGEMQVGHNRIGGGDVHREDTVPVGLLGANLSTDNGLYKVGKIFTGERWNPFFKAPLAAPGIGVKEGDYILAVNGRKVTSADNIYAFFEGTVGDQVSLTISSSPDGSDPSTIVVEPTDDDGDLRDWADIERRRKRVEEATEGRVGYVYLPNTAGAGYTYFNRMFFAQSDKDAMIIDERWNGGGQAANYITDVLSRTYLSGWKDRDAHLFNTPGGGIYGPKVMLINEGAGSGGDFLPYSFKRMGIGKLMGTRTWGGLIGISANPGMVDGGFLTVPFFRFFTPDGEWRVENEGVSPDIEVLLDPIAYNKGIDTQLEAAIAEILDQLKDYTPVDLKEAPPYPTALGQ